jgi:hypothetical protein
MTQPVDADKSLVPPNVTEVPEVAVTALFIIWAVLVLEAADPPEDAVFPLTVSPVGAVRVAKV